MSKDTLSITDNRTGKQYEIPITHDTIRAMDLRQIRVDPGDFGMMSYDPAFTNTASCTSRVTFIDGDKGILEYRGYPIEQLAEEGSYLETAYLLLNGELPARDQLDEFGYEITHHTLLHENLKKFRIVLQAMQERAEVCTVPKSILDLQGVHRRIPIGGKRYKFNCFVWTEELLWAMRVLRVAPRPVFMDYMLRAARDLEGLSM